MISQRLHSILDFGKAVGGFIASATGSIAFTPGYRLVAMNGEAKDRGLPARALDPSAKR
jgi:hypothetical protein